MRLKNEPAKLYYAYANEAFDSIETEPKVLFQYPDEKIAAIDGDITKVGDTYHLMYVSHDGQAGIKHAISDRPEGPFRDALGKPLLKRPDGLKRGWSARYYREVCINRMYFNEDGTIKSVEPTL